MGGYFEPSRRSRVCSEWHTGNEAMQFCSLIPLSLGLLRDVIRRVSSVEEIHEAVVQFEKHCAISYRYLFCVPVSEMCIKLIVCVVTLQITTTAFARRGMNYGINVYLLTGTW